MSRPGPRWPQADADGPRPVGVGPLRVAPGVWVVASPAGAARHPVAARTTAADRADARGRPGWRAAEILLGRGLLRGLLDLVVPDAADAPVVHTPAGRPELAGWPRLGVSVSHDRGTVAAAVAVGRRVGVDVQHPVPDIRHRTLARCLRDHAASLTALPPRHRDLEFAWVWSAQEACVKAEGSGLAGRPWTVDVRPLHRRGRWRGYRWRSLRDQSPVPLSCAYGPPPRGVRLPEPPRTGARPITRPSRREHDAPTT
ncbi:MAG TPA: 4'-phosphopantetheinyl transferase superfamily protein [Pilimelia sp.]|nr:4'-phosphopantetheinyl transferase superfamily protein [Pilimelia sp.]